MSKIRFISLNDGRLIYYVRPEKIVEIIPISNDENKCIVILESSHEFHVDNTPLELVERIEEMEEGYYKRS